MATAWFNPRLIVQYPEDGAEDLHVRWDDSNGFSGLKSSNGITVGTMGDLFHIARSPKPNLTNKTFYIRLTNYNFSNVPDTISGIELKLMSKRAGRIVDDTVSLTYQNNLIGENQANLEVNPIKFYGSSNSLWGLESISKATVIDPSFGIVLRFKSHPSWPHRNPVDLDSVELRIH